MARVNVEQVALTDSRFAHLGLILLTNRGADNIEGVPLAPVGVGVMVYVWNECQERSAYVLPAVALDAIGMSLGLSRVMLSEAIVQADLGVRVNKSGIRIKGTEGRIEWREKLRESNRIRQARHRASRPHSNALVTRDSRGAPTPTPALALTTSVGDESPTTPLVRTRRSNGSPDVRVGASPLVNGERVKALEENFSKLYEFYPRHVAKDAAWKAFLRLSPDADTLRSIAADVKKRVNSGEWIPDGDRITFIPHLSTYLNQRRWTDGEAP